jgi:hypothetical protein
MLHRILTLIAGRASTAPTLVITLGCAIAVTTGCGAPDPLTEGSARVRLLVGVDTSKSFRARLGMAASWTARTATRMSPSRDWLVLNRVEDDRREILAGPAPRGGETFLRTLVQELQPLPVAGGTRVDLFWEAAAEHMGRNKSVCGIVLVTDGHADGVDHAGHRRIRHAARRLAANPSVKVVAVVGVATGRREEVRRDLGALGSKLRILRFGDDPGIVVDMLVRAAEEAR